MAAGDQEHSCNNDQELLMTMKLKKVEKVAQNVMKKENSLTQVHR